MALGKAEVASIPVFTLDEGEVAGDEGHADMAETPLPDELAEETLADLVSPLSKGHSDESAPKVATDFAQFSATEQAEHKVVPANQPESLSIPVFADQPRVAETPGTEPAQAPALPSYPVETPKVALMVANRQPTEQPDVPQTNPAPQMSIAAPQTSAESNLTPEPAPKRAVQRLDPKPPAGFQIVPTAPSQSILNVSDKFEVQIEQVSKTSEAQQPTTPPQVLETRVSTQSQPPVTQLAREVAAQIVDKLKPIRSSGMELQLSPKELGSVSIRFVPSEAGIIVNIIAERVETGEMIRRHADVLLQEFRQAGFGGETTFAFSDRRGQHNAEGHAEAQTLLNVLADEPADPNPVENRLTSSRLNLVL